MTPAESSISALASRLSKKSRLGALAVLLTSALGFQCFGQIHYVDLQDGLDHTINYGIPQGSIRLDLNPPGMGTSLNLVPGGKVDWVQAYNNSQFTLSGGTIRFSLDVLNNARATISSGAIGQDLAAFHQSRVTILSVPIGASLFAGGSSEVECYGADIGQRLSAGENARVSIYGGSVGTRIIMTRQGQVTAYGGRVAPEIYAGLSRNGDLDVGTITLVGSEFAVNGISVGPGSLARDYAAGGTEPIFGDPCLTGTITGKLADGTAVASTFYIVEEANITFADPTNIPMNACSQVGAVFCDANSNNQVDVGDTPLKDILIIVTNMSGTFSNAAWTREDGSFQFQLPCTNDTYIEFPSLGSLPAGSTNLNPWWNSFTFAPGQPVVTNYYLVSNPGCVTNIPVSNTCWLSGGGFIRDGKGRPPSPLAERCGRVAETGTLSRMPQSFTSRAQS